jgi:hypothetical protein
LKLPQRPLRAVLQSRDKFKCHFVGHRVISRKASVMPRHKVRRITVDGDDIAVAAVAHVDSINVRPRVR